MPRIAETSVLDAVMSLTSRTTPKTMTDRGSLKVISVAAIAKRTGKSNDQVKAILAANRHALLEDEKGRVLGVGLLRAASNKGLLVERIRRLTGSKATESFLENGQVLRRFDIDFLEGREAMAEFEAELKASGKLICAKVSDIPDTVLKQIWQEDGLLLEGQQATAAG